MRCRNRILSITNSMLPAPLKVSNKTYLSELLTGNLGGRGVGFSYSVIYKKLNN